MKGLSAGWAFEVAVCEALGIDPTVVERLEIVLQPGNPPRITAHQFMQADAEKKLVSTFRLAEWKPE